MALWKLRMLSAGEKKASDAALDGEAPTAAVGVFKWLARGLRNIGSAKASMEGAELGAAMPTRKGGAAASVA